MLLNANEIKWILGQVNESATAAAGTILESLTADRSLCFCKSVASNLYMPWAGKASLPSVVGWGFQQHVSDGQLSLYPLLPAAQPWLSSLLPSPSVAAGIRKALQLHGPDQVAPRARCCTSLPEITSLFSFLWKLGTRVALGSRKLWRILNLICRWEGDIQQFYRAGLRFPVGTGPGLEERHSSATFSYSSFTPTSKTTKRGNKKLFPKQSFEHKKREVSEVPRSWPETLGLYLDACRRCSDTHWWAAA